MNLSLSTPFDPLFKLGSLSFGTRHKNSHHFILDVTVDIPAKLFPSVASGTLEDLDWDPWGEQKPDVRLYAMLNYAYGTGSVRSLPLGPPSPDYIGGHVYAFLVDGRELAVFGQKSEHIDDCCTWNFSVVAQDEKDWPACQMFIKQLEGFFSLRTLSIAQVERVYVNQRPSN